MTAAVIDFKTGKEKMGTNKTIKSLEQKEYDWLVEFFKNLETGNNSKKLSPWEKEFTGSIRFRFEQYGKQTFMSTKQWDQLEKIDEKIHD